MNKFFLIILSIIFYILITFITSTLDLFYDYTNLLLSALFLIFLFSVYFKNERNALISYVLFTLVFLFYRSKLEVNMNNEFYLIKWLKIIFDNKIVLINILGNLLLFMPYVVLIKSRYYFLMIVILILGLEYLQFLTKRGVLDIVDIILNIFGCILVIPIRWRVYEKRKQRKTDG